MCLKIWWDDENFFGWKLNRACMVDNRIVALSWLLVSHRNVDVSYSTVPVTASRRGCVIPMLNYLTKISGVYANASCAKYAWQVLIYLAISGVYGNASHHVLNTRRDEAHQLLPRFFFPGISYCHGAAAYIYSRYQKHFSTKERKYHRSITWPFTTCDLRSVTFFNLWQQKFAAFPRQIIAPTWNLQLQVANGRCCPSIVAYIHVLVVAPIPSPSRHKKITPSMLRTSKATNQTLCPVATSDTII